MKYFILISLIITLLTACYNEQEDKSKRKAVLVRVWYTSSGTFELFNETIYVKYIDTIAKINDILYMDGNMYRVLRY